MAHERHPPGGVVGVELVDRTRGLIGHIDVPMDASITTVGEFKARVYQLGYKEPVVLVEPSLDSDLAESHGIYAGAVVRLIANYKHFIGGQIFVKLAQTMTIDAWSTQSIESIMRAVQAKCGMPVESQALTWSGPLEPHRTLAYYGIAPLSTLHLYGRLASPRPLGKQPCKCRR
jgi:hypothetical protein